MNNHICETHNQQFELICYDCNKLLCPRCIPQHITTHINIKHFRDISETYNNILKVDLLDNYDKPIIQIQDENTDFQRKKVEKRMIKIWLSIKSMTSIIKSLEAKEIEISKYFGDLHEFLRIEEHKLKRPITTDIDSLKEKIELQLKELKSLVNIINLSDYINNNNENNFQEESEINQEVTIDSFQLPAIINLIEHSLTLNKFIDSGSKNIFNFNIQNNNLINHDNDDMQLLNLLELVSYHNGLYATRETDNIIFKSTSEVGYHYKRELTEHDKVKFRGVINYKIDSFNNINDNSALIHWMAKDDSLTLFFKDNQIYSETQILSGLGFNFFGSYKSMVKVGEYIYVFGGGYGREYHNRFCRISLTTKLVDLHGIIDGIAGGSNISACYDGQNYIYLIGGLSSFVDFGHRRIDRYNIQTSQFEHMVDLNLRNGLISSTFYNNFLYLFRGNTHAIHKYNPETHTVETRDIGACGGEGPSCTDGNGSCYKYILFCKGCHSSVFLKVNLNTYQYQSLTLISKLKYNTSDKFVMYYKNSGTQDTIHLKSSSQHFIYKIRGLDWEETDY